MKKTAERQPAPRLSLRGVQAYLNVVEAPQVQNRKLVSLLVMCVICLLLLSLGMVRMLPLKERVPYVVKVEQDAAGQPTGRVTVSDGDISAFEPTEAHIRYFLSRWAEDLLSIDANSRAVRLPASYAMLKGAALQDWNRYVMQDTRPLDRLASNPGYRQRAELISITFLGEKRAMIRVKLTTPDNQERRVQLTVEYALIPPTTDAEVYRNPIGLWITAFGVTNELA